MKDMWVFGTDQYKSTIMERRYTLQFFYAKNGGRLKGRVVEYGMKHGGSLIANCKHRDSLLHIDGNCKGRERSRHH